MMAMRTWMRRSAMAAAVLVAAGLAWSGPEAPKGNDWPQFLGPNHNGTSGEAGWSTQWTTAKPKKLWEHEVGVGYACVSTSGGRAYTMGNKKDTDTVFCFDAVSGEEIWKQSYPCRGGNFPGPRCSPTIDGGLVYTVSIEGQITCWKADKGEKVWSKTASDLGGKAGGWGFACSPLVLGDKLIVDVGLTAALDKKTGEVAWKSEPYTPGYSSPVVFKSGEAELLAVFTGEGLKVMTTAGKAVAAFPWKTSYDVNAALPAISGNLMYITSGYGRGGALLKLEGGKLTKVWENKDMSSQFSTPLLVEGRLYGVSGNVGQGPIKCLDFKTGKVLWTHAGTGAVILVDGKMVNLSTNGRLAVANVSAAGYSELGATEVGKGTWWNAPVLSNGLIYCRSHEGKLVCLDVRK